MLWGDVLRTLTSCISPEMAVAKQQNTALSYVLDQQEEQPLVENGGTAAPSENGNGHAQPSLEQAVYGVQQPVQLLQL